MSHLASYLKNYVSEKASMRRLRNDIINKSTLIKPKPSKLAKNPKSSLERKLQKIYRFVLSTRGGADYEYKLASQIENLVIQLAIFLKKKELNAKILKFIFRHGRLVLQLILARFNINLQYILVNPETQGIAVIACCTGGTAGFVLSWFSVGTVLFGPPTILSVFLVRSSLQQIIDDIEYIKLKKNISKIYRIVKDENSIKEVTNIFLEAQKQIDNSEAIKLESLNWNKNPAERLGIFENPPCANKPLKLDTLDPNPELEKMLEELGIRTKPNPRKFTKAKTCNFRDFIRKIIESNDESDLDVIDVDVKPVEEPLSIRIRDRD